MAGGQRHDDADPSEGRRDDPVVVVTTLTQQVSDAQVSLLGRNPRDDVITDLREAIAEGRADDGGVSRLEKRQKPGPQNFEPKSENEQSNLVFKTRK